MNLPNEHTAILVVSFGTSHEDTRKKTIDAIEKDIADAYPQCHHFSAWTSRIIAKKTGHPMIADAIQEMITLGIQHVLIQPTHIMKAIEFETIKRDIEPYLSSFQSVNIGTPLLASNDDIHWMAQFLMNDYTSDIHLAADETLVFMGHGTEHSENAVYTNIQETLTNLGCTNILIGTVEGSPNFQDINLALNAMNSNSKKLCLAPLMIVAGDHAKNDLWGDEEDSWKSMLQSEGYQLRSNLKGLGEYSEVRKHFLEKLKQYK